MIPSFISILSGLFSQDVPHFIQVDMRAIVPINLHILFLLFKDSPTCFQELSHVFPHFVPIFPGISILSRNYLVFLQIFHDFSQFFVPLRTPPWSTWCCTSCHTTTSTTWRRSRRRVTARAWSGGWSGGWRGRQAQAEASSDKM